MESFEELPQHTRENQLGSKGVGYVDNLVSNELRWILRPQPTNDLGIDGHIEIVNDNNRGTGRLIAAQIKCGPHFFKEQNAEGVVFRGEMKHYNYWRNHSLPVILIICKEDSGECWWTQFSIANAILLDAGWKITIPHHQRLNINSKHSLTELAGQPQHTDIVELLLYQFLYAKYHYIKRVPVEIVPSVHLPRDYHAFAYLATINTELVMIDYHYDHIGRVTTDHIKELNIPHWRAYNMRAIGIESTGLTEMMLFIVSEKKEALKLSEDLKAYLSTIEGLEYFRLLYCRGTFPSLTELDDNDDEIFDY